MTSPFGGTSDEFCFGRLGGQQVVFVPRHGRGHPLPPSGINFRANIDALKRCGVTDIASLSAVGSLREDLAPGDFVLVDQFIDRICPREKLLRYRLRRACVDGASGLWPGRRRARRGGRDGRYRDQARRHLYRHGSVFLLVSGDTFLRRLVEVLPHFRNKRQAVDISQQIESDISAYLATITLMNAGVGVATGIVAAACGLGDPMLWGVIAFLLNYVPILGPMIGVITFLFAGLLSIDTLWVAFLPAGLYLAIHMIEGETVTPMLLARRFTINPVLVIVALVFWYWMWGVPGAILATPMLAVIKIVCDRVQSLSAFGHFIEG